MAIDCTVCTSCSARLKPAKPLADGAKIKCPKCGSMFVATQAPPLKPSGAKPGSKMPAGAAKSPDASKMQVGAKTPGMSKMQPAPMPGNGPSGNGGRKTKPVVIWGVCFGVAFVFFTLPMVFAASYLESALGSLFGRGGNTPKLKFDEGNPMYLGPLGTGDHNTPDTTDPNKVDIRNKPVDVTVSPKEFKDETEGERDKAATKYGDKVVQVEGKIHLFLRNINGDIVNLEVEGSALGLNCIMAETEPWAKLAMGQTVKIKGWCPKRYVTQGNLFSAVVVEAGENPAPRTSAAELGKEYAADRDATLKKYEEKPIYVDGEIDSKMNQDNRDYVVLKGVPGVVINCYFIEEDMVAPLKPGQKIRVLGVFDKFGHTEKSIGLSMCNTITK